MMPGKKKLGKEKGKEKEKAKKEKPKDNRGNPKGNRKTALQINFKDKTVTMDSESDFVVVAVVSIVCVTFLVVASLAKGR